jgi:hypothetical protein
LFLSKAELDYLTTNRQFNDGYIRVIKSRLQKKIEVFVNQELPILVEKGYLDITEFRNVTENCYALVAQAGYYIKKSLGGDLNPRPLPPWDFGTSHPKPYQGNALPG